jgi:hypothetical protein
MTERAKKIMKAYEAEDTYNFPNDGVASAIREIVSEFGYYHGDDDCGRWVVSSIDLIELANELEAL